VNLLGLRAGVAALAVAVSSVAPIIIAPTGACADTAPRAVLVVDTSSQVLRYCVRLNDESVSGTELIVLASRQYGLTYRFGFGGGAVCMLAGVGTTGDDCFEDYPDFWGYWRGDGGSGWTWSGSGAASTTVSDGDVEGWSWGSGNDGSTHPPPPSTRFAAVCTPPEPSEGDDDEPKDNKPRGAGAAATAAPRASSSPSPPAAAEGGEADAPNTKAGRKRTKPRADDRRKSDRVAAATSDVTTYSQPSSTPSPRPIASAPRSSSGPPAAGLVAVVAAGSLIVTGVALRRRGRVGPGAHGGPT
jgi:hypothetical protein